MVKIKKILVPVDFSNLSVPAIGYACSLARDHEAEVVVLHSVPAAAVKEHFGGGYGTQEIVAPGGGAPLPTSQASVENILETKKRLLVNFLEQKIAPEPLKTVKIRPVIRLGKVIEEIVAAAREEQCDLIVMTSNASRLRRLLRGSFTEGVIRRAPCPVLSIQPSAEIRTEHDRLPVRLIDRWAA